MRGRLAALYHATLTISLISLLTSLLIVTLYLYLNNKKSRRSSCSILQNIIALILADGCVGLCLVSWGLVNHYQDGDSLDTSCRALLPALIIFLNARHGFTGLVCIRFLKVVKHTSSIANSSPIGNTSEHDDMHVTEMHGQAPTILYVVWCIAFTLSIPIAVPNLLGHPYIVSHVVSSNDTVRYCTFDTTWLSMVVSMFSFEIPSFLTILVNTYAFLSGMRALRFSPHSVLSREMKRVGQYIAVLILVWVPCLSVVIWQWTGKVKIDKGDDDDEDHVSGLYATSIGIVIFLISAQGLLNAVVYALEHRAFQLFFHVTPFNSLKRLLLWPPNKFKTPSEPFLSAEENNDEPVTQNGYICPVTYTLGDDIEQHQTTTMCYEPPPASTIKVKAQQQDGNTMEARWTNNEVNKLLCSSSYVKQGDNVTWWCSGIENSRRRSTSCTISSSSSSNHSGILDVSDLPLPVELCCESEGESVHDGAMDFANLNNYSPNLKQLPSSLEKNLDTCDGEEAIRSPLTNSAIIAKDSKLHKNKMNGVASNNSRMSSKCDEKQPKSILVSSPRNQTGRSPSSSNALHESEKIVRFDFGT